MRAMAAIDDGIELVEIPRPAPGTGEVLVGVVASALNPADEKVLNGDFAGRFLHARTSPLVLGWDFAGTVAALGAGVTDVGEGMEVWGHLAYSPSERQGANAEYVTVPRAALARLPEGVPLHVAAAAATISMTGLQSLRDLGRLSEGGHALVIGAGGGVGSVAVGIAKRLGARVTAVCGTKDVERVHALGADHVIDRSRSDPFDAEAAYDVVFDTPAAYSFGRCASTLRGGGTYVTTLPGGALVSGVLHALFTSKRCRFVRVQSKRADLELVGSWLREGLPVPVDSRHRIRDLASALARHRDPGRAGKVVIDVDGAWPA